MSEWIAMKKLVVVESFIYIFICEAGDDADMAIFKETSSSIVDVFQDFKGKECQLCS